LVVANNNFRICYLSTTRWNTYDNNLRTATPAIEKEEKLPLSTLILSYHAGVVELLVRTWWMPYTFHSVLI
jgi:hypothetical protein